MENKSIVKKKKRVTIEPTQKVEDGDIFWIDLPESYAIQIVTETGAKVGYIMMAVDGSTHETRYPTTQLARFETEEIAKYFLEVNSMNKNHYKVIPFSSVYKHKYQNKPSTYYLEVKQKIDKKRQAVGWVHYSVELMRYVSIDEELGRCYFDNYREAKEFADDMSLVNGIYIKPVKTKIQKNDFISRSNY